MDELTDAVSRVVRRPVELTGAGRTDAGVHAWGQVVSGDLPEGTDLDDVARRVNKLCAPDISVRDAAWVDPDFDARFSATWRQYRYHIWNDPAPNPLVARTALARRAAPRPAAHAGRGQPVDRRARLRVVLPQAQGPGRSATGEPGPDPPGHHVGAHRRVPLLRMHIRASVFCHQMVRSICGTLVDVGLHKLTPADVNGILRAEDRAVAGQIAPPQGLVLWEVGYDGARWDLHRGDPAALPDGVGL